MCMHRSRNVVPRPFSVPRYFSKTWELGYCSHVNNFNARCTCSYVVMPVHGRVGLRKYLEPRIPSFHYTCTSVVHCTHAETCQSAVLVTESQCGSGQPQLLGWPRCRRVPAETPDCSASVAETLAALFHPLLPSLRRGSYATRVRGIVGTGLVKMSCEHS